jgi:hemerythrin-like domain-containing protein
MSATQNPSTQAPRFDLYGPVHKGIRRELCGLLERLGSANFGDAAQRGALLQELRGVLQLMEHHIHHENSFVHPAAEERIQGSSASLAHEHAEHEEDITALRTLTNELEQAQGAALPGLARQLYVRYGEFVGESLVHMAQEEHTLQPQLHSKFSDGELMALDGRIISSLAPPVMMAFMRAMIPAMNPDERALILGGMKQAAPPEAFNAVLQVAARPNLSAADWKDLTGRLGVAS